MFWGQFGKRRWLACDGIWKEEERGDFCKKQNAVIPLLQVLPPWNAIIGPLPHPDNEESIPGVRLQCL